MDLYCVRHGETAWSLSGQHTGVTDLSLTDEGRRLARRLGSALANHAFALVMVSPLRRAVETCDLAGFGDRAAVTPDLREWNYGAYEGLTPREIDAMDPGWMIFRDGCPGGEMPEHVGERVDRVIARAEAAGGDVLLFAHGHVLRTLAARWIGLPPQGGRHFRLDTGTLCVLGHYRSARALRTWNAPLVDQTAGTSMGMELLAT